MDNVTTVGIDLAKNVFSLHGVDERGRVLLRRTVSRTKLSALVAQLSPCVIGMEACSGAHEWARRFSVFGHTVRLMAPKFVAPYRNDQPHPRLVGGVRRGAATDRDRSTSRGSWSICLRMQRVREYELQLEQHARGDERAKRIQALGGIGPISASALVASVADAHEFSSGRQFAAWLGLIPKQFSTGGKTRLGHITAHGDPYLRTLLIMGARSMLQNASRRTDRLARWALAVRARRGYHRACVAIAAKHARIVWAMLAKNQTLQLS